MKQRRPTLPVSGLQGLDEAVDELQVGRQDTLQLTKGSPQRSSQARGSNSARAVLPTRTSPQRGTSALSATVTATTRERSVGSTGHQQLTICAPLRDAYSAAR